MVQQLGSGNLVNSGIITRNIRNDGSLGLRTVCSTGGKTYLVDQENKKSILLSENGWKSINILHSSFYYSDVSGRLAIYKPENAYNQILDQFADEVVASGRWVYYSKREKNEFTADSICKIDLLWGWHTTVCANPLSCLSLQGESLYFSNEIHDGRLYKVGIDGKNKACLNDDVSRFINVVDGFIYYINGSDNDSIYRIKLDGSDRKQVIIDSSGWLNCYRGLLFYSNKDDSDSLYVHNVESGNRNKLTDLPVSKIHLIGEWCYFINRQSNKIDSINISSSGK